MGLTPGISRRALKAGGGEPGMRGELIRGRPHPLVRPPASANGLTK
jgi:hypothetical protein